MKKLFVLLFSIALLSSCLVNKDEEDLCTENPQEDCICTRHYDPVCGCNEKTYGNACEAECDGIRDYTEGKCPI